MNSGLIVSGLNNLLPAVTGAASQSIAPAVAGAATAQLSNILGTQAAQKAASNIISENGVPKVLYHGSPNANIDKFDLSMAGKNTLSGEKAIYFTDDMPTATDFSYERLPTDSMFVDNRGKQGKVYERYLQMSNPLNLSELTDQQIQELWPYASNLGKMDGEEKFISRLQDFRNAGNDQLIKGQLDLGLLKNSPYDGFSAKMYPNQNDVREYGVFDPANILTREDLQARGILPQETEAPAQQYFQGKDLNNDGMLNQMAVQRDINGDGVITPEEAFAMATGTQDTLNKNLRTLTERLGFPEYQDVRQKSLASIKNKIERKGGDYTAMSMKDHSRSKITMNSWADIPQTIEALQQAYPNADMSIENVRNDWGYSGLHITFREPNGIGVEVQLTTPEHWPVKLESDAIYDKWRTIASKDPSTLEPIVQKRLYAAIKKSQALWKAANVPDLSKYANV